VSCIVIDLIGPLFKIELKLGNFIILKRWNNQRDILSFIKFNRTSSQSDEGENIRGSSISGWPSEVNLISKIVNFMSEVNIHLFIPLLYSHNSS